MKVCVYGRVYGDMPRWGQEEKKHIFKLVFPFSLAPERSLSMNLLVYSWKAKDSAISAFYKNNIGCQKLVGGVISFVAFFFSLGDSKNYSMSSLFSPPFSVPPASHPSTPAGSFPSDKHSSE